METQARYVLIGFFTVTVCILALFFAVWLANPENSRNVKYYNIVFNQAVNGLSVGSMVEYNGITVGDVTDIALDKQDPQKVWTKIRITSPELILRQDTQAKLIFTSITGTAAIQLSSKDPNSPILKTDSRNIPVIVATPSSISTILSQGERLVTELSKLTDNANHVLSAQNQQNFAALLQNLQQVTDTLAQEKQDIKVTLHQLSLASQQTEQFLTTASQLLNHQGKALLDNSLQNINQIGPLLDELSKTLATLRNITYRLSENPTGYLLGRDNPQEFSP